VIDEIEQAREYGEVKWTEGEAAGVVKARRRVRSRKPPITC
jgi:hypothetical protein